MRKFIAILTAKIVQGAIRIAQKGSGSALPGLIAQKIDPTIISNLAGMLPKGIILVTGTNGKTTTVKMIAGILKESGLRVVCNFNGSNLSRGLASMLIQHADLAGTRMNGDIGLFEVDEAVMPEVTAKLNPNIIVVTNLFRDQLDRYGELDKTAEIIGSALKSVPQARMILNADDPLVANLSTYNANVSYFGIDSDYKAFSQGPVDLQRCLSCKAELAYHRRYFSHLGNYYCPKCHRSRPELDYLLKEISLTMNGSSARFMASGANEDITIKLPGFYNLYNSLAAASVAEYIQVPKATIRQALAATSAPFGRMEKISLSDDKNIFLILVKNPTSFIQSLDTLGLYNRRSKLLLALNDNLADGTDISWIWDVDFKTVSDFVEKIFVSGLRAEDMELRLKYAGFTKNMIVRENKLSSALETAVSQLDQGETLYVFPTYTAMLTLRRVLADKALVKGLME